MQCDEYILDTMGARAGLAMVTHDLVLAPGRWPRALELLRAVRELPFEPVPRRPIDEVPYGTVEQIRDGFGVPQRVAGAIGDLIAAARVTRIGAEDVWFGFLDSAIAALEGIVAMGEGENYACAA